MPRRGSPYGPAYQQAKRALAGWPCHVCGLPGSDSIDHVPALADHVHVERSHCCRLLPAHLGCNFRVSGGYRAAVRAAAAGGARAQPAPDVDEPDGFDVDDPAWAVPWLDSLRDVPHNATWPRLMTVPHPRAVGSYGAKAADWLSARAGIELRYWQRLALVRQLEHDADGRLVWLAVLVSASRQSGKSVWLRALATWRLHAGPTIGEPQTIVHTAKDLPICKEVQRAARAWAKARGGYKVREQNGNEEIAWVADDSRWLIRGKDSVYGYTASVGLVDECWGVAPDVVEDGLEATMLERRSPQLVLTSTAHRKTTALYVDRRAAALDELAAPNVSLLMEWSARRGVELDDVDAWRTSSPHWGPDRERQIAARLQRVLAGETLDRDEDDPTQSFIAQILNVWPVNYGRAGSGEPLLEDGLELVDADLAGPIVAAVADWEGRGAAAAAAGWDSAGRLVIGGWTFDTIAAAAGWAQRVTAGRPGSHLVVAADLVDELEPADWPDVAAIVSANSGDTRAGLSLLRSSAAAGLVVNDGSDELAGQIAEARVTVKAAGLSLVTGPRADLLRAAVWAMREARRAPAPEPAIY